MRIEGIHLLKNIVKQKYQQVQQDKQDRPLAEIITDLQPGRSRFKPALAAANWALIAECKLASPAKGQLCSRYSVVELAQIYQDNGATALSVHTDPHFCGQLSDIAAVQAVSQLPILRKDFIIDDYQIYESCAAGADCILLSAAILDDQSLRNYLAIASELGLDCLVEVHSKTELARVNQTPALLIGINNRDLTTFTTNIQTTLTLKPYCRQNALVISESGVKNASDARLLRSAGVQGILVGEGLVTAEMIDEQTRQLALKE
jgi:indole-3-glycerol phosphate synthase